MVKRNWHGRLPFLSVDYEIRYESFLLVVNSVKMLHFDINVGTWKDTSRE